MDCTMNDSLPEPQNDADASRKMHDALQTIVDTARPQTPGQFGTQLFHEKWGQGIDPQTALLVTLDYNYQGHPPRDNVHQGRIASSRTLLQALLGNYQTVADGRFGETAFGLYTPPDIGPAVRIVGHVDEFALQGSGNHQTYEGIYRRTEPQVFGPQTQIALRPADFKQWVWTLELKQLYQAYLTRAWPADAAITAHSACALRTSVKAAGVMSAWLQRRENSLSQKGLELALQAAGLPAEQAWSALTLEQLQVPTRVAGTLIAGRLELYRYTATDIWMYRERNGSRCLLYIPGNSSPWHEFADDGQLQGWIVGQGKVDKTRQALASHFDAQDRVDGTFHAGVLTTLEGMALYPNIHRLTKTAGFFNNDGFWPPADYIGFDQAAPATDPFAQLVLSIKRAAQASAQGIRDDGQVNRDNLNAFVEPLVQWVNRFGALALFVPGGEGVLALAGLIDAGYGLDQAIDGETASQRSEGLTRTVFGLLNALPVVAAVAHVGEAGEPTGLVEQGREPSGTAQKGIEPELDPLPVTPADPQPVTLSRRVQLLRGIGSPVDGFSDETLAQIARVSVVSDDLLRLMNAGHAPTPMLADTLSRFRLDRELAALTGAERSARFSSRYQALQQSDNAWVRLFQRQYPGLPKGAVEQILDRYGVDLASTPEAVEAGRLLNRLDGKARQYQQHVRLNRAYEGLYLRSVSTPESATLALHSLPRLPGWPQGLRLEVYETSLEGRLLDRCGPLQATDVRRLIKTADHGYATPGDSASTDFHEALLDVLSDSQRAALQLPLVEPAQALKRCIAEYALARSELMTGLDRMDSGLPFQAQGLRGGGFPTTPQGAGLGVEVMRLQVSELYPGFSRAQVDGWLLRAGGRAQAQLDGLRLEFEQLCSDLNSFINQTLQDADDMDVDFLAAGDAEAAGMDPLQIRQHNIERLQDALDYERETREELVDELILIWQQRPPLANHLYADGTLIGYKLDMDFEDFHRLPDMQVRFDQVLELSMRGFHLVQRESLHHFLESFPRLRRLNLEQVDLRLPFDSGEVDAAGQAITRMESVLPPAIPQMRQLTSLNLRSTFLQMNASNRGQLCDLSHLQSLDLSENPLGVSPLLLGMNELRQVCLRRTAISTCPVGILDEPYLTLLDLRDNRITRIPPAVVRQAIAPGRVLLWNNPLTDEDTLQRLVSHRQQTGINLWLREVPQDYGDARVWLRDSTPAQLQSRSMTWQRLAAGPMGSRFLRVMDGVSLTPEFLLDYPPLQARVWRMLGEADASDEMFAHLARDLEASEVDADNPMALFMALEGRAQQYRDWVSMGRPIPVNDRR
jgi:hypothetical protein